ncbi:hypothetical protein QYM36_006392, partial [Artemia franciscana]
MGNSLVTVDSVNELKGFLSRGLNNIVDAVKERPGMPFVSIFTATKQFNQIPG